MPNLSYDCLVVGAGFAGAVAAHELAERGSLRVLLLEQRFHTAGNAYDCKDTAGVLVHLYGPHIFHTNSLRVYDYLSRFTAWRNYRHEVLARVGDMLLPLPFNFTSLEMVFGPKAPLLEKKLLASYGGAGEAGILALRRSGDAELRALSDYVYDNVFSYYTQKQWGTAPEEIDEAVTARVPVRLSHRSGYFLDRFQGMPKDGYAALFGRLLDHPNITVLLGTDAGSRMRFTDTDILLDGAPFSGPVIYTGAPDALFGCRFGALPYRTLDFEFETLPVDFHQPVGTVNYTVSEPYTRITEFKHLTGQLLPGVTTIAREYSRAAGEGDIPYYAILNDANRALYDRYAALAARYPNLHLLGRLAEYRYYNMDAVVERALTCSDALLEELQP